MKLGMRYFTLEQREALQQWLEQRANQLRAELDADLRENLSEEPVVAAAQRDAGELRDVEAALARLHDPKFGRCAACEAEISYARLITNPAASLCMTCQRAKEKATGTAAV